MHTDIHNRLNAIRERMRNLPEFHPGKLSQQYVRCGKKNCHCRNLENPKKHGPYYQLSYAVNGKNSTMFVKEEQVEMVRNYLKNYELFKDTIAEFAELNAQFVRQLRLGKS